MSGPPPAVAATRRAVRRVIDGLPPGARVVVAVSGGADSLALAAAAADEARALQVEVGAVVIDHGLQGGSATVAAQAAQACRAFGLTDAEVVSVAVDTSADEGPEAAARTARYAALAAAAARRGAALVLLGHTEDDQAEQVLLGLLRGSGARSLSGMPARRGIFARPFLHLSRDLTRQACVDRGLTPWEDPHNADPAYRRVRVRDVLAQVSTALGPSIVPALARSAALLRVDADYLDGVAGAARSALGTGPYAVAALEQLPEAIRTRVWRLLAIDAGVAPGSLTARHVAALDALVADWHGQGAVSLPGAVTVTRSAGTVTFFPVSR